MHCVFYNLPRLEAIVREIPNEAQAEAGLNQVRSSARAGMKRKRENGAAIIEGGLDKLATAISNPVQVDFGNRANPENSSRTAGLSEIGALLDLEDRFLKKVEEAKAENKDEPKKLYEERLEMIRKSIDKKMKETLLG